MSEEATPYEKYREMNRTAFVLGYTGEVGKELVKALDKSKIFSKVILIGRRPVDLDPNLGPEFEQKLVNFDKLEEHEDIFKDAQVGYCCLGTTRGKSGKEGFIKVDKDYVLKSAELAKENGCKHFSVVSSSGGNKNSWFLYTRIKGEVEETLKSMQFERLSIFKPAILMCEREENRTGEKMVRAFMKPMSFMFPTYGQVPTSVVAQAMVTDTVTQADRSTSVFDNKTIHQMGKTSV